MKASDARWMYEGKAEVEETSRILGLIYGKIKSVAKEQKYLSPVFHGETQCSFDVKKACIKQLIINGYKYEVNEADIYEPLSYESETLKW